MNKEQINKLLAPFTSDEVKWRLRNTTDKGGYAVPYLDSRAIQNRLDDVLGKENWQNTFIAIPTGNTKDPTANVCVINIYFPERKEWISKSDGAGASDIEPVKGGLSDSFKRAASMWGVGRYMYNLSDQWVDIEVKGKSKQIAKTSKPKLKTYYEKAIAEIFGVKPQSNAENNAKPPPKPNVQKATPPKQKSNAVYYTVKSANLSKGGDGAENTSVQLEKPDGGTVTAYIRGNPGIQQGQKLSNIKTTEKTHPQAGKYFVIDEYQLAA